MIAISPNDLMFEIQLGLVPYTFSHADCSCFSLTIMFSSCTDILAQLAQSPCLSTTVILAAFNMDRVFKNRVANSRSTFPFC
jgi:hypothetical protein